LVVWVAVVRVVVVFGTGAFDVVRLVVVVVAAVEGWTSGGAEALEAAGSGATSGTITAGVGAGLATTGGAGWSGCG
jgi:hypothetical protein